MSFLRQPTAIASLLLVLLGFTECVRCADTFQETVLPLLQTFCVECHSTQRREGELDLEQFDAVEVVKSQPAVWGHVYEQLENKEMPPKDARQLSEVQRRSLLSFSREMLDEVARATAGDPGPVAVRRLSNWEYTYSIRDLTDVMTLDPAAEFPQDGAAGEGFTNAGSALVMSPSLLNKYLDAAKKVAEHVVLLPDGIRFSPSTSSRDWTDEALAKIREFYSRYSVAEGGTDVDLQGIRFTTNAGGRLPVERYVTALVGHRELLTSGQTSFRAIAQAAALNERYLQFLWNVLNNASDQPILSTLHAEFKGASANSTKRLIQLIIEWQSALWHFSSVGHIGKQGGPTAWQEPTSPLNKQVELRLPLNTAKEQQVVSVFLSVNNAGDGDQDDFAIWENLRLVAPGRQDLPIRELQSFWAEIGLRKQQVIDSTARCLAAAAEANAAATQADMVQLSERFQVDQQLLAAWFGLLGIDSTETASLGPLLSSPTRSADGTVAGWQEAEALSVVANSSDQDIRIPGKLKARGFAAHPSPSKSVVVAWRSPFSGLVAVEGIVQHAHPECGNGVNWTLEVRRGRTRQQLSSGLGTATPVEIGGFENIKVLPNDLIALAVSPRDGNHVCDLTMLDLTIRSESTVWNLAEDVVPDILNGNPHADQLGNPNVWAFAGESIVDDSLLTIPMDSLLAKWQSESNRSKQHQLAGELQRLLGDGVDAEQIAAPDRDLIRQLLALNGPLLRIDQARQTSANIDVSNVSEFGIPAENFGRHPNTGQPIALNGFCIRAPSLVEVRIPAELADGAQLVATGRLLSDSSVGSVQMRLLDHRPDSEEILLADCPIISNPDSKAWHRFELAFAEFRRWFPISICYPKIVPVDEVVTLRLFYREDEHLQRLMLNDAEKMELNRIWEELLYVSDAPIKQVDAFEQLYQYSTQDSDPSALEPLKQPLLAQAAAFRESKQLSEAKHLESVIEFANRAWRRPLTDEQQAQLRQLFDVLREQELPHAAAIRTLLTRILVSPQFLYRGEQPGEGELPSAVSEHDLATRLSYFLWSSTPDREVREAAEAGLLQETEVLRSHVQRMLADSKVRRLATEFGCQWLQIRDVATLDEKSERHFPTFIDLRSDMQEEAVRFFIDLFQNDRSLLALVDADYGFVNTPLAEHYALQGLGDSSVAGQDWRRIEGLQDNGRGGVMGFAAVLAKQSGASRTSPILRGNWLSEVVLGETLPRPPKDVPILPDETPAGLTERQLVELHSSDPACASCHQRIDPLGFALEGFDAIGRIRTEDSAGHPVDTSATLLDGTRIQGIEGLKRYLLTTRRDDFLRQFCRKLLGFALGRGVQLSDHPLIESMLSELNDNDFRVSVAVEQVVLSPQFRNVRGREYSSGF
ncbi:MAG: DUF1592 domain-containing protein [Planctomycetales bacterium]|nr:DUF1592 domain-containing protein [Planctomycetales bacterium]